MSVRHGADHLIRLEPGGARVSDPAVRTADEDETPKAGEIEGFFDPSTEGGRRRHVCDDVVHDWVHPEVRPKSLDEVTRVHVSEERLTLVVLVEDLRQVQPVEVAQGTDRVAHPIHEGRDGLFTRTPGRRDDFED